MELVHKGIAGTKQDRDNFSEQKKVFGRSLTVQSLSVKIMSIISHSEFLLTISSPSSVCSSNTFHHFNPILLEKDRPRAIHKFTTFWLAYQNIKQISKTHLFCTTDGTESFRPCFHSKTAKIRQTCSKCQLHFLTHS